MAKAKHAKPMKINIPLYLTVLLLCLTLLSIHLTNGMFARYISTMGGGDSARVIRFGDLTLVETGDFASDNHAYIVPGVNLQKKVTVSFDGSEAATYVFAKVEVPLWSTTNNYAFSYGTNQLQFSIAAGWTYLSNADGTYVYYRALEPNTPLASADVIANEGNITVSDQITKTEIQSMTDISINLTAAVVQIGEFESPADAWASLAAKE